MLEHPEETNMIVDYASRWAFLGLFPAVIVAAALGINRFKPHHVLGLATAGFILRIALRSGGSNWYEFYARFFTSELRASFGFASTNLPLWGLFLLMGLILYCDAFIRSDIKIFRTLKFVALLLTASFLVFIIIISKTRSIWILSCLFIPSCVFLKSFQYYKINLKTAFLTALLILLIPSYFVYQHSSFFGQRLAPEIKVLAQIVEMQDEEVPLTSIGLRYNMVRAFVDNATVRPMFGWGPGLSRQLLTESPYARMREMEHFHNIFIESYLQLGLVGLGLFLMMFGILFRAALTVQHALYDATRFRWLLVCSMALFCLAGLSNHTLWSSATAYFFALMGGIAYSPVAQQYTRMPQISHTVPDEKT